MQPVHSKVIARYCIYQDKSQKKAAFSEIFGDMGRHEGQRLSALWVGR